MAQNLLTPALDVFGQMALDEVIAGQTPSEPVLRFYHWTPGPAVTFGYAQFYDFVRKQTGPKNGPLCRRPTGGGVVFHGTDLTFSVIFLADELRPAILYARLHGAIEKALEQFGIFACRQGEVEAAVYTPQQNGTATGCFVNPVQDDLLYEGHKILGGAIRRFGRIVLYQGSLQCPEARKNPIFRQIIQVGLETALGDSFRETSVSQEYLNKMRVLAQKQYMSLNWIEKF